MTSDERAIDSLAKALDVTSGRHLGRLDVYRELVTIDPRQASAMGFDVMCCFCGAIANDRHLDRCLWLRAALAVEEATGQPVIEPRG